MMTATGSSQINFFPSARSTNKLMRQKASNQINQYDDQTDHRSTACQMNQLGSLSIDALKRRQAWRALNVLPFIPHEWTASDQFIPWIAHNLDKAQHQFDRQDAQKEHSYLFIYTHCRLKSTALRRIRKIQNQSAFSWSASQNQFGSMDQKDPRSNGNQLESTFWIRSTIFSIGVTVSIPLLRIRRIPIIIEARSASCVTTSSTEDDQHLQFSSRVLRLLESVSSMRSQHRAIWWIDGSLCS